VKLELIQPFINAADAVLTQTLDCGTQLEKLTMEDEAYRRHGIAAEIRIAGDVEGRVILDLDADMVASIADSLAGGESLDRHALAYETICEVANQVIGNAVTELNDRGFRFRIHPPLVHTSERGLSAGEDTEALLMSIVTCRGRAYLSILLHYASGSEPARAD